MRTKGFTLIELLVVIAIIGVLASIVLASLDGARKKGRDARRISDLKQIQLALELYYDANNAFPPGVVVSSRNYFNVSLLESAGFISKVPVDPSTGANYLYTPYGPTTAASTCSNYHLGATLESVNHTALAQDNDIAGSFPSGFTICTAGGAQPSVDFNGLSTGANCAGVIGTASPGTELCYDLKP